MAKRDDAPEESGPREIKDLALLAQDESTDQIVLTRDELQALIAAGEVGKPNPAPAVEEGPHLQDPEIREAKRQQLVEALDNGHIDESALTDDMRSILEEVEG